MSQNGEINLSEVKAKYSVPDIKFVDSREVDFANEFRLTYEISLSIGWVLLGFLLTKFDWIICLTTIIFLGFGIFNIFRYKKKYNDIKKDNK